MSSQLRKYKMDENKIQNFINSMDHLSIKEKFQIDIIEKFRIPDEIKKNFKKAVNILSEKEFVADQMKHIDSFLDKAAEYPFPVTTYRSFPAPTNLYLGNNSIQTQDKTPEEIKKEILKLKDSVVTESAYLSTSLLQDKAMSFAGKSLLGMLGIRSQVFFLLEIEIPPGARAAYIAPISKIETEQEVLIGRNSQFKIVDVSIEPQGKHKCIRIKVKLLK